VRNIRLKRMYHSLLGNRLLCGAAAIIATSEQEAEELRSGGLQQLQIALRRNGVEAPREWPEPGTFRKLHGIHTDAKLLLFLGRLSWKKSPELLLEAVASLPAQLRDGELKVIFAGPDEGSVGKELRTIATELGLETQVELIGPIYGPSKWAAYKDADVFVLPSQNENFGNSAAEAVLAGTPVIVTEQCGIAPLLAGRAGIVVPHDASALSAALARILTEHELREQLAIGCSRVAAEMTWDQPVREMESLYERLVGASRA
jgi:glycosyltransferase involved in cell wall biosynthesis